MRARRNRILAWVAAGVLIVSLTLAGMIIYLGRFQGPDTGAKAPTGITSTQPIAHSSPSTSGAFTGTSEVGDGVGEGGFQTRRVPAPSHSATAPARMKVATGSAGGG